MDPLLFNKDQFPWVSSKVSFDAQKHYPKISVVVPSYNQADYLEETLLSIIRQNYPHLELIVIDGGSKDHSVEVIKLYETYITYWVSEEDRGQSHAINKGLEKATGEWVAWMNSDDCYLEGAFYSLFHDREVEQYDFLYGNTYTFSSLSKIVPRHTGPSEIVQNKMKLFHLLQFFYNSIYIIPSQSVFLRKSVMDKVGLLNEDCHFCMDLEWYARFSVAGAKVMYYDRIVSFFRINDTTKTGTKGNGIPEEAMDVALKYSSYLPNQEKKELLEKVNYFKRIRQYMLGQKKGLVELLQIAFSYPSIAFQDPRYKVLLKGFFSKNE